MLQKKKKKKREVKRVYSFWGRDNSFSLFWFTDIGTDVPLLYYLIALKVYWRKLTQTWPQEGPKRAVCDSKAIAELWVHNSEAPRTRILIITKLIETWYTAGHSDSKFCQKDFSLA